MARSILAWWLLRLVSVLLAQQDEAQMTAEIYSTMTP